MSKKRRVAFDREPFGNQIIVQSGKGKFFSPPPHNTTACEESGVKP